MWSSGNVQVLNYRICGERSFVLRVERRLGAARFRVSIIEP
jgi:hypothetical protein